MISSVHTEKKIVVRIKFEDLNIMIGLHDYNNIHYYDYIPSLYLYVYYDSNSS